MSALVLMFLVSGIWQEVPVVMPLEQCHAILYVRAKSPAVNSPNVQMYCRQGG
jgi:hypothetical protein